jgi:hypothetical protein
MAETPRGKAFFEFEPIVSDDDIKRALDNEVAVLSLRGKPVPDPKGSGIIQFLAVKFALSDGTSTTVLMDRMAASVLRKLVEAADSINWDGNAMRAGPERH